MPSGQQSGHPPDSSQVNEFPLVSTSSCTFRHFTSGLLALVSLSLPRRGRPPPFPQRSPPRLFAVAACGGLKPPPDGRLRGACPHLSCSSAPPFLLVLSRHTFIEMPMRCGRGRGPRSSLANYDPNFNTHRLTVS